MRSEPHSVRTAWQRLAEPTLVRRSVASVMAAFVIVWGVLLSYNYINYKQAITYDPGLAKYGDAVLESLAPIADPAQAAAALASTDQWTNIRRRQVGVLPGTLLHELKDAATGQLVFASPSLRQLTPPPTTPAAVGVITEAPLGETIHRIYTGSNARWALRVIEPKRMDANFLQSSGRALLPYLLLASPFVLLPVWLSVRNGLQPLQQLASRIAQRGKDDLQPVGFNAQHRELKPLEQSLDHLFAQLRQKVERERAFVQDAAHEIRTPLAVITAQAHVMARSQSEDERTEAQAHLEQAIARTSHLAQQLLDLAALDEAQRPAPRDLDVAQWLRAALAQAVPQAMARQIELSLDAPDSLPARLDLPALESVVHNLLDNAVRYALAGGTVAVGLRADNSGTTLQLAVQDDGPGIPAAEQGKVFERFYRGPGHAASTGSGGHNDAGHATNGSGLGLAIVRQAALRMGGQVRLGQGLGGRGVGFFVEIPLAARRS
ncbi:HAMP domain-containing sensor histidine kinase [Acidovorax sp. sic0104]|uniref:sensor histidine kinase n=1 Tax=Acidovorax sp. sic0104 TaxID=2854784 RepID=UPI001C480FE4|nr:ATP-binding protein [Acidovorax sp. sic0104]MBV7543240.1 sensor histidine kinase [Acidovorax sp. sic0104]